MSQEELDGLSRSIRQATGNDFAVRESLPVGGGCINEGARITGDQGEYFVKWNRAGQLDMFEAEEEALETMVAAGALRVPRPIVSGTTGSRAYLVLEWISMQPMDGQAEKCLGRQLAEWHGQTGDRFGWHRHNTIGATPQINTWSDDWILFWKEHRLGFQFQLAREKGLALRSGDRLLDALDVFFDGYDPEPSPCHGDLWGGNAAMDADGKPVLFDPAFYYGDRETDLAFTEMFGGFGPAFYSAYREAWPLDPGYSKRRDLYNLYHVLNHFNLFGGGYGSQAERMVENLVEAIA